IQCLTDSQIKFLSDSRRKSLFADRDRIFSRGQRQYDEAPSFVRRYGLREVCVEVLDLDGGAGDCGAVRITDVALNRAGGSLALCQSGNRKRENEEQTNSKSLGKIYQGAKQHLVHGFLLKSKVLDRFHFAR